MFADVYTVIPTNYVVSSRKKVRLVKHGWGVRSMPCHRIGYQNEVVQ